MDSTRFNDLLDRYITGTLSKNEQRKIFDLLEEPAYLQLLDERLRADWEDGRYEGEENVSLRAMIEAKVNERIDKVYVRPVHRVHFLKTSWFRYAAAVLIILGIGAYLWNTLQKDKPLITETKPVPVKNDVAPGSNRAVLTLSDGQQVELNNAASETIKDGTLAIENVDGQLRYGVAAGTPFAVDTGSLRSPLKAGSGMPVAYNTMSTPKGGQYQLTLSDGTKVWLNAASSITYPVAFNAKTREVTITGEAYFEVKKNSSKPFVVKTPKEDITVLGTSFNVNAYPDEGVVKTSLVEGSVKIANAVLRPGEAYVNGKVSPTNLDQDVAWKNGEFNFEDMNVQQVMKQVSRWYDLDVVYQKPAPDIRFFGSVSRDVPLSTVLLLLQSAKVKFVIEGKKLIIQ